MRPPARPLAQPPAVSRTRRAETLGRPSPGMWAGFDIQKSGARCAVRPANRGRPLWLAKASNEPVHHIRVAMLASHANRAIVIDMGIRRGEPETGNKPLRQCEVAIAAGPA